MDWASRFSIFTGFGLLVAYALLGCPWLIMKTEGTLQEQMRPLACLLALALLGIMAVLSLWMVWGHPQISQRWFALPNLYWLLPVPLLVLLTLAHVLG